MASNDVVLVEKATAEEEREVARSIERWQLLSGKELETVREKGKLIGHLKELTRSIWKRTKNKEATWDEFARKHLDCTREYGDLLIRIDQHWAVINAQLTGKERNINRAKKLLREMFPAANQGKRQRKAARPNSAAVRKSVTKQIKVKPSQLLGLAKQNGFDMGFVAAHYEDLANLVNDLLREARSGVVIELDKGNPSV